MRRAFLRALLAAAVAPQLAACARRGARPVLVPPAAGGDRRRVVVVGSGITGLVAAALLARLGHHVTVLESHPTGFGGHARSVEIGGLEVCFGPQYVWGFEEGKVAHRVLAHLGLAESVRFVRMAADGFERCFVGDAGPIDVPMGLDRFHRLAAERFPAEREGLDRFFAAVSLAYEASRLLHDEGLYLRDGAAMRWAVALSSSFSLAAKVRLLTLSRLALADLFDACELSPGARRLLYATGGLFGESEATVSLYVYAAALGYYHEGAFFPEAGFSRLIDELVRTVREAGGEVLAGKRVVRLELRGDRVEAASCADGSRHACDLVVSNLSPRLTCALVGGCDADAFRYEPSRSAVACCFGLRGHPGLDRLLARRNVWWQRGDRAVEFAAPDTTAPPEMLFVGSPTANGYGRTPRNPDGQALVVFAPGSYAQARDAWEAGAEAYDALRARIAERMLDAVERHVLPGVAERVAFVEVRTPLEIERDTHAEAGNAYGRRLDVAHVMRGVRRVPGVANLHVSCATVGLPGIATGFNTARLLVEELAGVRI